MFAQLRVLRFGRRCTIYSLAAGPDDEDLPDTTLFDHFLATYTGGRFQYDLSTIVVLLDTIMARGADRKYFRDEDYAVALPKLPGIRLRLYAIRFGERALVLCSGGEKTSQRARDGATRAAFDEAQRIGRALDKLRESGDINGSDLQRGQLPTNLIFEF